VIHFHFLFLLKDKDGGEGFSSQSSKSLLAFNLSSKNDKTIKLLFCEALFLANNIWLGYPMMFKGSKCLSPVGNVGPKSDHVEE
jgi:hypothetical protein